MTSSFVREEFQGVFDVQVLCLAPSVVVSDAAPALSVHRHPQPHAAEADRRRVLTW